MDIRAKVTIFLFERDMNTLELIYVEISVSNLLFIDILENAPCIMAIVFTGLPPFIEVT